MLNKRNWCEDCQRKKYSVDYSDKRKALDEGRGRHDVPIVRATLDEEEMVFPPGINPDLPPSRQAMERSCLGCDKKFLSQGRGNRMCKECQVRSGKATVYTESC